MKKVIPLKFDSMVSKSMVFTYRSFFSQFRMKLISRKSSILKVLNKVELITSIVEGRIKIDASSFGFMKADLDISFN